MLLYNKRESEIDIYHMEEKEEELKKYRKKLLKEHAPIFYELRTNSEDPMKRLFNRDEVDIRFISYNTPLQWSFLEVNDKSKTKKKKVMPSDYEPRRIQKNMIKKYINGEYSTLKPTRVFEFISEDDLDCTIYHFLKPDCATTITKKQELWQIENMLDLPEKLYLLQLLQLGNFEKLISKDIEKQLQLFDIDYWKSVKISDVSVMLETGLVNGTVADVMKKVETSSKILQKVRK